MSDYIPEEILQEILLKLPVKSLIRCTAVCKSWRSLIKSSTFVKNHLSHTIQSNHQNDVHTLLLHKRPSGALYSVNWDNPTFGEHINVAPPFVDNNSALKKRGVWPLVVGTYNGLVCLASYCTSDPIIVCNPSIRKYVILPEAKPAPLVWRVRLEFGYDSRNDDYKVLRIRSSSHQSGDCEVDIWSLSRGSWKTRKANLKKSYAVQDSTTALVNGALHRIHYVEESRDYFILCIDMVSELFEEINMPRDLRNKFCSIIRYGESIGLLHVQRNAGDSVFQVWVMKEYGVVDSWTKQFDICLQGVRLDLTLSAFKSSGEVLLRELPRDSSIQLFSVDLKSKHVKQFGIDVYQAFDSFVESLILLGQTNACSYKD